MSKISPRRALLLAAIVPIVLVTGCSATSNTQAMKGEASPATPTDTMMSPEETDTDMMSPGATETGTESPSPTGTATGGGGAAEPRTAVQNYFNALKSGNVDQVVSSFADDAVAAVDGEATATGSQAIRTLFQGKLKGASSDMAKATHTIDEARTAGTEDAFVRSTSKQGDDTFREFFILTKDGGKWMISRFMNNKSS